MDQVKAKLIRLEDTEQGSIGALSLFGELFCNTLEPDSKDLKKPRIPEGIYYCKRRIYSPSADVKYHHTFEIMVPGHTNVLIHYGNKEADTDMCVIVGINHPWSPSLDGIRWLYDSKKTFDAFMKKLSNIDWFYIEIKNLY